MEEEKLIDQSQLAESVSDHINLEFGDVFLVKPLDPIKVKKEFSKLPEGNSPTKDENDVEAIDYKEEEVQKEVKEVDADFQKGVVLKVPFDYKHSMEDEKYPRMPIKVGDIVVYEASAGRWFDLIKDTRILRTFNIVAVERSGD